MLFGGKHSSKWINLFDSFEYFIEADTIAYLHFTAEITEMPRSSITRSRYKTSKWHNQNSNSNHLVPESLLFHVLSVDQKHSQHLGAS